MPKDKSKKSKEKVNYFQAITGYKISIKDKELKDANEELNKLVERNFFLKERTDRLNQTRQQNIQKAMSEYKTFTHQISSQPRCERDDVTTELKSLLSFKSSLNKELLDIKKEIKNVDKDISNSKQTLKYWNNFKKRGTKDLDMQIFLLKKELADMNENYEIISSTLRNNITNTVNEIKKNTENIIEKKNKVVAEKCLKFLDRDSVEKSKENEWTREKLDLFRNDLENLKKYVSDLEQENIQLMSYLFECNNQEVKFVRDVITNQFLDNENLELNSIMDVDLEKLDSVRPQSALKITLKKLKEIELKNDSLGKIESEQDDDEDVITSSRYNQKKLYLDGQKKNLIKQPSVTQEEFEAQNNTGEYWPITQEMLNSLLNNE